MTETRKQIIELIWEHMDKTITEWCLIKWKKQLEKLSENKEDLERDFLSLDKQGIIKILWHYDITAVFAFIEDNRYNLLNRWNRDYANPKFHTIIYKDTWYIESDHQKMWDFVDWIEFKLKPLNLYTEQEEKDLLELLLKLK